MASNSQTTDEAADYVESIMSTQQAVRIGTPLAGRKRNRSAPSPTLSTKKARNADIQQCSPSSVSEDSSTEVKTPTRRSLYGDAPTPAPRRKLCAQRFDNKTDTDSAMEKMIDRLSIEISNRFSELNDRIDRLEQGLEQRISSKVAQLLDKRISTELKRLRKDVDSHVETVTDSLKAEVVSDIADINKKVDSISAGSSQDLSCNIVIRNLQEHQNENVSDKVNSMIREGCSVQNVVIASAERKRSVQGKPGVVIAKFKSVKDKSDVMQNKRKLKNSRRFKDVFIHHDQSRSDRLISDNFRTMLSALRNGENLSMKGSRVIRSESREDNGHRNNTTQRDTYSSENRRGDRRPNNRSNGYRGNQYQSRR